VKDQKITYKSAFADRDHGPEVVVMLLARKLDLSAPGEYTFRGIEWPNGLGSNKGDAVADLGEDAYSEIKVTILAPGDREVRGKTVKATGVRIDKGKRNAMMLYLDENRRVLTLGPEDESMLFVAGAGRAILSTFEKSTGSGNS
jgi:hypothetical protein